MAELWRFLESYPELFTNGYRYWERIRGKLMEAAMRPMEVKIEEEGDRGEGENGGDEGGEGNGKGKREDGGNGNRRSKWNWRGTPLDRGERWYEERELEHKVDASIGRFRGACGK